MAIRTISDFVLAQMNMRDMSARAFADFVGVSHASINRLLAYDEEPPEGYPSLDVLIKLSAATSIDLRVIVGLVAPASIKGEVGDVEAMILSQEIEHLSPDARSTIDALISRAARMRSGQKA